MINHDQAVNHRYNLGIFRVDVEDPMGFPLASCDLLPVARGWSWKKGFNWSRSPWLMRICKCKRVTSQKRYKSQLPLSITIGNPILYIRPGHGIWNLSQLESGPYSSLSTSFQTPNQSPNWALEPWFSAWEIVMAGSGTLFLHISASEFQLL